MFIALCQASHTAIYTLFILVLMNKPVLAPLTGVTPDQISVQQTNSSCKATTVKRDSTSGKMDHYYPGKLFRLTLLCIPRYTEWYS